MAIHWQVKFKSLRAKELFTVNIYDADYTGSTPVQLKGGESPFVTQEDDDDDMFQPVRTQSGYLRIVDDGCDADGNSLGANWWRTFIPATDVSRPVTLTDSDGNVRWMGFMQAQNFGSKLYMNKQEREFPVQCPLSVLDSPFPGVMGIVSFSWAISLILRSFYNVLPLSCIKIQGPHEVDELLQTRFDMRNLTDFDENGNITYKYTMSDLLEEICKFWGWTCRMYGDEVHFVCPATMCVVGVITVTPQHMEELDDYNYEPFPTSRITIPDIFASTDNNDSQNLGVSIAEVTSDCNDPGEDVIQAWPTKTEVSMQDDQWSNVGTVVAGEKYIFISQAVTSVNKENVNASVVNGKSQFGLLCEGKNIGTGTFKSNIRFFQLYDNGNVFANIKTNYSGMYGDGAFQLHADIYKDTGRLTDHGSDGAGRKFMWMNFGIGSTNNIKWYDHQNSAWSTTKVPVKVTIGNSDNLLRIVYDNGNNSYNTSECIPVWTPLQGNIYIELLGTEAIGSNNINVCDFTVTFKRTYNDYQWQTYIVNDQRFYRDVTPTHKYKHSNSNYKTEKWSADTIFASDNRSPYGYGLVIGQDGKYVQYMNYEYLPLRPEQYVAESVAGYWATSKRKITCDLLTHDKVNATVVDTITPTDLTTIDGSTMYPLAIERDWCRDVVRLTLMEV